MQTDSLIVPETVVKARSFAGLMSLYESNFIRLRQLVDDIENLEGAHCSVVEQDLPLHLEVLERTRYTATLQLTYLFAREGDSSNCSEQAGDAANTDQWLADPDLRLRVYFDGRLAEAMSLTSRHRHAILRRIASCHREELDTRWRHNMMLNKWLEYCIDAGHHFSGRTSHR